MGGEAGATLSKERLPAERRPTEPRAALILLFEPERPLAGSARFWLDRVDRVVIGRGAERAAERGTDAGARTLELRVPDPRMSATHARLVKALGRWIIVDADSHNGTVVNDSFATRHTLADGDLLELGDTLFLFRHRPAAADSRDDLRAPAPGLETLVDGLAAEYATLADLATAPVSIVLGGETGTGKEVVARAVHTLSKRTGPFIAVNCGALPATLIETELFGYRKGAFSGAAEDRPGLIRAADRGTLFLDEIGDLPLASQAAFLRVLQEREVTAVGATRPVAVDIRLMAATHRDLDVLVAEGRFRADLRARIAGHELTLPPLRERVEDIGLLTAALLARLGPRAARVRFASDAARVLFTHHWPLNVRELEKALGSATALAKDGVLRLGDLPDAVQERARPAPQPVASEAVPLSPDELARRDELIALLREHAGNVSAVARALGKARMQIHRWCHRFAIDLDDFRTPQE